MSSDTLEDTSQRLALFSGEARQWALFESFLMPDFKGIPPSVRAAEDKTRVVQGAAEHNPRKIGMA